MRRTSLADDLRSAVEALRPDEADYVGDLSQVLNALRELGLPRADALADAIEATRERAPLTAQEAHDAILAGKRVRLVIGEDPQDPTLLHWLHDGMIIAESIAGWSAGVVEAVCSASSPFYVEHYAGHGVLTLEQK